MSRWLNAHQLLRLVLWSSVLTFHPLDEKLHFNLIISRIIYKYHNRLRSHIEFITKTLVSTNVFPDAYRNKPC